MAKTLLNLPRKLWITSIDSTRTAMIVIEPSLQFLNKDFYETLMWNRLSKDISEV